MGPEHKFAMYTCALPLLDDAGLQFEVRSSCSVQYGVSSLLCVDYDTTLSQLPWSFIAVCTEFQVRQW